MVRGRARAQIQSAGTYGTVYVESRRCRQFAVFCINRSVHPKDFHAIDLWGGFWYNGGRMKKHVIEPMEFIINKEYKFDVFYDLMKVLRVSMSAS